MIIKHWKLSVLVQMEKNHKRTHSEQNLMDDNENPHFWACKDQVGISYC
jgi:hypothetical protein